jgi:hypothetical protein
MKLNRKYSIVFLAIYGMIALFIRLYVEPVLGVSYIQSISIGLATLVPLWIMFRLKFLTLAGENES